MPLRQDREDNLLYIAWMVILGDHGIKKDFTKTSTFEVLRVKNCISRLYADPLGETPPTLDLIPKEGEKHVHTA